MTDKVAPWALSAPVDPDRLISQLEHLSPETLLMIEDGIARENAQKQKNPLLGMYLHTLDAEKQIDKQGMILNVYGSTVFVQIYSWMSGEKTNVEAMSMDFVCSGSVLLYATREDWISAAERSQ